MRDRQTDRLSYRDKETKWMEREQSEEQITFPSMTKKKEFICNGPRHNKTSATAKDILRTFLFFTCNGMRISVLGGTSSSVGRASDSW